MKKLKLFTMACLLSVAFTAQAGNVQTLVINGEKVEKVVARITFEGDNVVLTFSDQTAQTTDMENVKLSFTPEDLTAIGTIRNAVNKTFSIEGLEPGTEITVYNADGKQVLTTHASEDLTILKMTSLKKGVYLMKAGKQVVKFIKR
jgi:methionine-rich copper-binding protein CopC